MDGPPSTATEERLRRGALVLGKYVVDEVLGEGGTGVVYAAHEPATGAEVALKVMHPHLASEVQVRGRFMREGAILRRLEGPHLCRILELGEVENPGRGAPLLCLVLPRIHGRALDALLREGPLPEARASTLMREVLEALESAHGQGVIHRDLKPHNVLVDPAGRATVVDFGLSKIVNGGGGTGTTNLTALNMVFGTPEYMSPEQAQGDELDGRCDLYACGVMLFEMLTGRLPFTGATPLAILTAHLTQPPPSLDALVADGTLSRAVCAIVQRALSKDPAHRYSSAGAMRSSLERAEIFPDEPDELLEPPAPAPPPTPGASSPPEGTVEAVPATKRTGAPGAPDERDERDARVSGGAIDEGFSATELSLSPRPPGGRAPATSDTGRRSEPTSRARASQPTSRRSAPAPRRDLRWLAAWVVVLAASVAVGVALGLRGS